MNKETILTVIDFLMVGILVFLLISMSNDYGLQGSVPSKDIRGILILIITGYGFFVNLILKKAFLSNE